MGDEDTAMLHAMAERRDASDPLAALGLSSAADEITRLRAERDAAVARAEMMEAALKTAVLAAAIEEYRLRHPNEGADERLGRTAAVRGMMVRLELYAEFNAALDLSVWPSPTLAALQEPRHE